MHTGIYDNQDSFSIPLERGWGLVVKVLGCRAEGLGFKSHSGQDRRTLTVHPAVNGYQTIRGYGLR